MYRVQRLHGLLFDVYDISHLRFDTCSTTTNFTSYANMYVYTTRRNVNIITVSVTDQ